MARIEKKAYYVGTWREDVVTDTTMRQIIARSHAEKGQKVKVKLSAEGISLSKTVLFQENVMSSFPLRDVYFLTVNQRHPTCLLCIVADPVKKYLILALRTASEVDAQEIINTFQSLKETPHINAGNVVLRRKDNGNWTLRERSQHNADRHLQEIFKETTPTSSPVMQPNGHAGSYAPVIDARKYRKHSPNPSRSSAYSHSGSQTVVMDGSEVHMAAMKDEVDHLSQELRDIKFVLEKSGTVSSTTLNNNYNNNNNNTEKSHYILSEVPDKGGQPLTNGGMVSAHSDGYYDDKPGEARVSVGDFRNSTIGVVRAHSNGSAVADAPAFELRNGRVERQITVPEPNSTTSSSHHITTTPTPIPVTPTPTSTTSTTSSGPYVSAVNGYTEVPAYTVHRRVTTEYVQVPTGVNRRLSSAGSVRSVRVKFDPEALRRSQDHHNKFRSLRTSRSGVPTTIVRPIEEIYAHQGQPAMVVHQRPSILKRQPQAVLLEPPPSSPSAHPHPAVYLPQDPSPYASVYVAQPPSPSAHHPHHSHSHSHHHHHHPQSGRRSRPSSIHVMEGQGSELRVFRKSGEVDDILL